MNIYTLILILALLTFASRAIPAVLIGKVRFTKRARLFLQLVPITSMTALVIPSIFSTDSTYISVGLIGGMVAAISAYLKAPVIISVLLAVLAVFITYQTGFLF